MLNGVLSGPTLKPLERRDWQAAALLMALFALTRLLWLWLEPRTAVYWEEAARYVSAVEIARAGEFQPSGDPTVGNGHDLLDYQSDHYQGGSLVVIGLASLLFRVVTPSLIAFKLIAVGFSTLICGLAFIVSTRLFDRATGVVSALAYVAGPSLVAYWGLIPFGSHGESIGFSLVQALLLGGLLSGQWNHARGWAGFGLVAGLGVWFCYTAGMTTLSCALVWLVLRGMPTLSALASASAGFAVGMIPWLAYNATRGWVGLGRVFEIFGAGNPIDHWIPITTREKLSSLLLDDLREGWLLPHGSDLSEPVSLLLQLAYLVPLVIGFGAAVARAAALLWARGRALLGHEIARNGETAAREFELVFVLYLAVFLAVFLGSSFVMDPNAPPVKYRLFLPIGVLLVPPAARSATLWQGRRGPRRKIAWTLMTCALAASMLCTLATASRTMPGGLMDPARFGPMPRGLLTHRKYESDPEKAFQLLRAAYGAQERSQAFAGFGWGLEFRFEKDGDFDHIDEWIERVDGEERLGMLSGLRYWSGQRLVALRRTIAAGSGTELETGIVERLGSLVTHLSTRYPPRPRAAGSASLPELSDQPNVLLIVIDNLRADHLGAYGYARPTSPHFDALAARGQLYLRAYAPSSWTKPSVASLFTSRAPGEHGAVSFERQLADDLPTLAEAFAQEGYLTLGVSGNFVHVNATTGLDRGFAHFRNLSVPVVGPEQNSIFALQREDKPPVHLRAPRASEVVRAFAEMLVEASVSEASPAPTFAYLHFMDPHAGFDPPEAALRAVIGSKARRPERLSSDDVVALVRAGTQAEPAMQRRLIDLYDGEVRNADHGLGESLRQFEELSRGRGLVTVVVSDHGEEFGEHGSYFHGLTLHTESLRIPMLFFDSRNEVSGRVQAPVDLIDVAPTLLHRAGVPVPDGMSGRVMPSPSETNIYFNLGRSQRDLVSELHCDPAFETHARPRLQWGALLRWPWKAIIERDGNVSWYHLQSDPAEQKPRGTPKSEKAPTREVTALAASTAARDRGPCASGRSQLSDDERAALRALGYVDDDS